MKSKKLTFLDSRICDKFYDEAVGARNSHFSGDWTHPGLYSCRDRLVLLSDKFDTHEVYRKGPEDKG